MSLLPPLDAPARERLLTAAEAAARLSIAVRTFFRGVAEGRFPPADIKASRKMVRWRESTIDNWIRQQSERKHSA